MLGFASNLAQTRKSYINVKLNYVTKKSSSNNLDCFNRDRRGYDGAVKRQSGLAGFVASLPAFAKCSGA